MGFSHRLKSVLLIREEAYWCVVVCECRQLMRDYHYYCCC